MDSFSHLRFFPLDDKSLYQVDINLFSTMHSQFVHFTGILLCNYNATDLFNIFFILKNFIHVCNVIWSYLLPYLPPTIFPMCSLPTLVFVSVQVRTKSAARMCMCVWHCPVEHGNLSSYHRLKRQVSLPFPLSTANSFTVRGGASRSSTPSMPEFWLTWTWAGLLQVPTAIWVPVCNVRVMSRSQHSSPSILGLLNSFCPLFIDVP